MPLFARGQSDRGSDVNQFSIITELLGTPSDDVIQTIASENVGLSLPLSYSADNHQTLRFVQSLPKREKVPFETKFPNADPLCELGSNISAVAYFTQHSTC